MAKFKTSINLADAVRQFQALANREVKPFIPGDDFFVVVDTFDFGRDVNGNTINKYRVTLHWSDLVSVQNGYSNIHSIEILTSPYRREQSHGEGQSAALYWLEKIGYDLVYKSMTEKAFTHTGKARAYRHVYRVDNKWLKKI